MFGRTSRRISFVVLLGMVVSLMAAPLMAQGAANKNYRIEVSPPVAADQSTTQFTVTFTNVDTNNPLGGLELRPAVATLNGVPVSFTLNTTSAPVVSTSDPSNVWNPTVSGGVVRLLANDSASRLTTNESVTVVVSYDVPDINATTAQNDIDLVFAFPSEGRQANNFNAGGNDFQPTTVQRADPVSYRDGDGLTPPQFLQSNQILVVSGSSNDCAVECSGTDTQSGITVEISVEACDVGTLVVDATDLFPAGSSASDIISGVYNYLPLSEQTTCFDPGQVKRVFVDVTIPKTVVRALKLKANDMTAAAYYGIDISTYDSGYVGDGNTLPACDAARTFNCAIPASNGPNGIEAGIVLILLPTDPAGSFR